MVNTKTIPIDQVVFDPEIYPRSELDLPTVARYAEAYNAGERLPAIILEAETNRLFDGRHRYQARIAREFADIEAEFHVLPAGVPAKLYAAKLSARNGIPIVEDDLREIAREIYAGGDDATIALVAKELGRARQTVEAWVYDIRQEKRNAEARELKTRRLMALLLRELGWTQQRIADLLELTQSGVSRLMNEDENGVIHTLDEAALQAALCRLPDDVTDDAEEIAERWREEKLFSQWTDDERELVARLRAGETIVVNMRQDAHPRLWLWAEQAKIAVRIDRQSDWGNPFRLPDDGNRDVCCESFVKHYWPHKPSLQRQIHTLRGKALGCWCAPLRCHGDFLKVEAER